MSLLFLTLSNSLIEDPLANCNDVDLSFPFTSQQKQIRSVGGFSAACFRFGIQFGKLFITY